MGINRMTIRIGGAAGDGVESSGAGFCQAIGRGGLHVFGLPDYYSRIRGGHNFYSVRISEQPLYSHEEPVHMLLALTEETVPRHLGSLVPGGAVVYDSDFDLSGDLLNRDDLLYLAIPLSKLAEEKAGTSLAKNTVALGVAAGLTGYDLGLLENVIQQNFARKGQKVVDGNLAAVESGYEEGRLHADSYDYQLDVIPDAPERLVINGTEAFSMGALAGGCRFVAGYPMTPGSLVLHWMAAHSAEYGVMVKHTEDEIAAINMAIGGSHMGARALVPTSGGGFALMVEALGLAGITETPVVIYNAQRPGPSTGLPTRDEQGDMLFMLYASQGEFPRVLLAPCTHEEAFVTGWRAFNLAEKYQVPVLVLSDHYLAVAVRTLEATALDFDAVEIERGEILDREELDALEGRYLRYKVTPSGVSPRAFPGHPKAVYVASGNEHLETGAISEEPAIRRAQVEKRQRKLVSMADDINGPVNYGPQDAEVTFVSWGSTYGPLREAIDNMNEAKPGMANMLNFVDLWPLKQYLVIEELNRARKLVVVEVNATAQLAIHLRAYTGRSVDDQILKYDGRPLTPEFILRKVRGE